MSIGASFFAFIIGFLLLEKTSTNFLRRKESCRRAAASMNNQTVINTPVLRPAYIGNLKILTDNGYQYEYIIQNYCKNVNIMAKAHI